MIKKGEAWKEIQIKKKVSNGLMFVIYLFFIYFLCLRSSNNLCHFRSVSFTIRSIYVILSSITIYNQVSFSTLDHIQLANGLSPWCHASSSDYTFSDQTGYHPSPLIFPSLRNATLKDIQSLKPNILESSWLFLSCSSP